MSLPSPYDANTIQDIVPEVARVSSKLSASSILQERRRVRYIPQTQRFDNPSSASQVNWTIQDTNFLDLPTASITFRVETWSTNQDGSGGEYDVAVDDGAWSVFRRLQLSDNSMLLEDIDRVAVKANAELYAQADQSWYDSVGSMMGLWKHSVGNALASGASKYAVNAKREVASARTQVGGGANGIFVVSTPAGANPSSNPALKNQFTVPLSMLSDFFKEQTLFPLRNAGTLFLAMTLASPIEALLAENSSADVKYRIFDIALEVDSIVPHPTYTALTDSICNSPDEEGLKFPFNATLLASQNIPAGASGLQSVQFAKASQNLRQVHIVAQSQEGLSSKVYPKQSTFCNPGVNSIYLRCGSQYFPSQPSLGSARQYADLQNAYGAPTGTVGTASIADIMNYYVASGVVSSGTAVGISQNAPYQGAISGQPTTSVVANSTCDCYGWAYNFDKLKRGKLTKALDLDGISTLTSSGAVIVLEMDMNVAGALAVTNGATPTPATATNSVVLTALIKFTRVLEMKDKAVRILG